MNYTKPSVAVIGNAAVVIESTLNPKGGIPLDSFGVHAPTAAYDLDE
jgi:hypothetical protein